MQSNHAYLFCYFSCCSKDDWNIWNQVWEDWVGLKVNYLSILGMKYLKAVFNFAAEIELAWKSHKLSFNLPTLDSSSFKLCKFCRLERLSWLESHLSFLAAKFQPINMSDFWTSFLSCKVSAYVLCFESSLNLTSNFFR